MRLKIVKIKLVEVKPRLVKARFNRFALRPVTWVRFRGRERSGIPSAYRSKYCSTRLCREILSLLKVSKNRQIITKYNIFWIKIFKTEGFSTLWKNSGKTIEKTLFLKIPCNTKKNHFDQNFQRWVPVEKGEKRLIIYQLFGVVQYVVLARFSLLLENAASKKLEVAHS